MVALTYGVLAPAAPAATPRKSLFARFMDALIESRMERARREIRRHIHLLPYTLDERGNRLVTTRSGAVPFDGR
ncbi:MAG: hypothetical protein ACK4UO_19890 [Pseudolabrys sp.]